MARSFSPLGRSLLRLRRCGATGTLYTGPKASWGRPGIELKEGAIVAFAERRCRERRTQGGSAEGRRLPSKTARGGERRGQKTPEAGLLDQWLKWASQAQADFHYVPDATLSGAVRLGAPMPVEALILDAGRRLTLEPDAARVLSRRWVRTDAARGLEDAPLRAAERALLRALDHCPGARGSDLTSIAGGHEALRVLCAWTDVGWVAPFSRGGSHTSLLRTTRALRATGPDMREAIASPNRRRALRRQAAQFHPDRFDDKMAPLSRAAMEALLRAAEF